MTFIQIDTYYINLDSVAYIKASDTDDHVRIYFNPRGPAPHFEGDYILIPKRLCGDLLAALPELSSSPASLARSFRKAKEINERAYL